MKQVWLGLSMALNASALRSHNTALTVILPLGNVLGAGMVLDRWSWQPRTAKGTGVHVTGPHSLLT
eukprot:scaffold539119_cov42-Prasinocladus_malaysianus.AAC.1